MPCTFDGALGISCALLRPVVGSYEKSGPSSGLMMRGLPKLNMHQSWAVTGIPTGGGLGAPANPSTSFAPELLIGRGAFSTRMSVVPLLNVSVSFRPKYR